MSTQKKIMVSGIQPTNKLTLGNYLGALKNWVKLQTEYECYFFAVDLHAITSRQDPKELAANTYFALATYLAAGIDLNHATIFVQSHVRQHPELAWVLNCFTYMGELSRMTQFKDKSSRAGETIPVGLFTYPTLMASDILLYQADLVPVGADQKQHLELTRDIAIRINNLYGDLFKVPEPFIPNIGARIMDLQSPENKMSKSVSTDMGAVFLSDSAKEIEKKFKRAVTDSGTEISYSQDKPGIKNLIDIQCAISGKKPQEIVASYQGKLYGHLKVDTANCVIGELKPLQEQTQVFLSDKAELQRILSKGAEKAAVKAEATLRKVYDAIGFAPTHS
ncbi:MAG: tryptophan--tRNA ligase [Deltaproteobacteria bacterium]|nr:tryptophan--tRNA ligase [Deltaproteobacteria bacterium]